MTEPPRPPGRRIRDVGDEADGDAKRDGRTMLQIIIMKCQGGDKEKNELIRTRTVDCVVAASIGVEYDDSS